MRTALVLTAGLVALRAGAASASPCGSDTSDNTDFSSDFSSSGIPDTPPCEGPCADYSAWRTRNMPAVILDLGVATRTFASPLGAETGSVTHDQQSFSYRVVGPASQPSAPLDDAIVAQLRLGAPLRHGLYLGGELELGGVTSSTVHAEMTSSGELGTPTLTPAVTALVGGVGVLGFGGRLGRVDLGIEVAGGGRAVMYSYSSTYVSCETTSTITAASAVLEGRARASVWLSPNVMLSAMAGKSALDDGMVGGVSIGFSNHAFARR